MRGIGGPVEERHWLDAVVVLGLFAGGGCGLL